MFGQGIFGQVNQSMPAECWAAGWGTVPWSERSRPVGSSHSNSVTLGGAIQPLGLHNVVGCAGLRPMGICGKLKAVKPADLQEDQEVGEWMFKGCSVCIMGVCWVSRY
jgi:hypothetical protein